MNFELTILLIAAGLFVGMLAFIQAGRRIGLARLAGAGGGLAKGTGATEGAVFALLGLMLAFAFSGAASRFEDRRHLITEEANAIGTAWLRLDLLPADAQSDLRELFRRYLDLRIAAYANTDDLAASYARLAEAAALQGQIWTKALDASGRTDARTQAGMLLPPALNAMFDIATTRFEAARNHPPLAIFLLLGALALVASLLVGYNLAINEGRHWFHALTFAASIAMAIYLILDLEYPRRGLIRVNAADLVLVELRQSM